MSAEGRIHHTPHQQKPRALQVMHRIKREARHIARSALNGHRKSSFLDPGRDADRVRERLRHAALDNLREEIGGVARAIDNRGAGDADAGGQVVASDAGHRGVKRCSQVAVPALGTGFRVEPVDIVGFRGDEQSALGNERLRIDLAIHVR